MRREDVNREWILLQGRARRAAWRGVERLERAEGLQRWLPFVALGLVSALSFWLTGAVLLNLHELTGGDAFGPDLLLLELARDHTPRVLRPLLFLATELLALESATPLSVLLLGAVLVLSYLGRWREAVGLGVAVFLVTAGVGIAKVYFQRARPEVDWALALETSFSFPSGHAASATVLYGMAAYLLGRVTGRRRVGVAAGAVAAGMILATAYSRVYLAVHYPTDVAAGIGVGAVWLATAIATTEGLYWLYPPRRNPQAQLRSPNSAAISSSSKVRKTGRPWGQV